MSKMYELEGEFLELFAMIDDEEIDEDMLLDTLEAIDGEIEIKAENMAKMMKHIDGEASAIGDEIKRLQARKKALENRSNWLKRSIEQAMRITGKMKFKTALFSFGIQNNPKSVKISDEIDLSIVPQEFLVFSEPTIDKKKLKESIEAGNEYEWAELIQTDGLRIR